MPPFAKLRQSARQWPHSRQVVPGHSVRNYNTNNRPKLRGTCPGQEYQSCIRDHSGLARKQSFNPKGDSVGTSAEWISVYYGVYDDAFPSTLLACSTACSDPDNTFAFALRAGKVELVDEFNRACAVMVSELWDGRLSEQGEGLEGSHTLLIVQCICQCIWVRPSPDRKSVV